MIWFLLGFSISLNIFLILLGIFIFKKVNVSDKLVKNLEDTKELKQKENDPWIHSM